MSVTERSVHIYFMSGTGNSYWAATRFSELAGETVNDIYLTPTGAEKPEIKRSVNPDNIIVFSYPTHGFSLPWHMLKFILRYPRGKGRVVLINNRAGLKMSKIFTPGISGIAILLPMLILLLKGYSIKGVVPLDTPSNWISIHPGVRHKVIDSIFKKRDGEIQNVWDKVSNKKCYYPFKFFILLPIDIFVSPISLGYIFFGRFILARTYLADSRCDGCGLCAAKCPVGAIKMVGKRPWWTYRCESCMRCANICPKKAVNSSVPLMIVYSVLLFKLAKVDWYNEIISSLRDTLVFIPHDLLHYFVLWIITMIGSWLAYILIFYLNRLLPFSYLFAFTTPMRFWRRYLAPGFKWKN